MPVEKTNLPLFKCSVGDGVFCRQKGLGIVKTIDLSNEVFLIFFLESKKTEPIGFSNMNLKVVKNLDPELAIPRELLSDNLLRQQVKKLAGLKNSGKKKTSKVSSESKKVNADALADKIITAARSGETLKLKDLL